MTNHLIVCQVPNKKQTEMFRKCGLSLGIPFIFIRIFYPIIYGINPSCHHNFIIGCEGDNISKHNCSAVALKFCHLCRRLWAIIENMISPDYVLYRKFVLSALFRCVIPSQRSLSVMKYLAKLNFPIMELRPNFPQI